MKEYEKMSSRDILNSFGALNLECLYDKIENIRPKKTLDKFNKCSTNCQTNWIFEGRIKELEEKRLPYKIFKRIEWFEPNSTKN